MPKTPRKNKNQKKKLKFITDVSNNKLNIILDMTKFKNPLFNPLETSNENNKNDENL